MTVAAFGAVIVNFNCARFAVDAALSFIAAGGARVVIVDNASSDDSIAYFSSIREGAEQHIFTPPPAQFEHAIVSSVDYSAANATIRIISAPKNGGFAYGCNIGLLELANDPAITHFLLLNPDALVANGALEAFEKRLKDSAIGLCGATVVDFESPHRAQAFGGAVMDPLLLIGRNLGRGADIREAPSQEEVERSLSYPLGAVLAMRRDFLQHAGMMDERYFLYYEEADWVLAGADRYRPGWARGAVVYHRYGASSKSQKSAMSGSSARSILSDFHMTRSRILFAAKWSPALAPVAAAAGGAQSILRLIRGKGENARAVLKASLSTAWRTSQMQNPQH